MEEKVVTYSKGNLKVYWKPKLCMHSKKCWKNLPEVFKPDEKKWIQLEHASEEDIKHQVDQCPSGALSYAKPDEKNESIEIQVTANGPLIINGKVNIKLPAGNSEVKNKVALCRCGASSNKPYCDGEHNKIGFKA